MRFIAAARTCGTCVVHYVRASVARAGVRTLQSHNVVNWCVNVLPIASSVNCGKFWPEHCWVRVPLWIAQPAPGLYKYFKCSCCLKMINLAVEMLPCLWSLSPHGCFGHDGYCLLARVPAKSGRKIRNFWREIFSSSTLNWSDRALQRIMLIFTILHRITSYTTVVFIDNLEDVRCCSILSVLSTCLNPPAANKRVVCVPKD